MSEFDFDEAAARAWRDCTKAMEADGEDVEEALREAGAGLLAWQGVPPSSEPPDGFL